MLETIVARGVRKSYPDGTEALKGVSFSLCRGARFSLLGPNGAGKSTLVRIMAGLSYRSAGTVTVCGKDPHSDPRALQVHIGVVSQENDLDPSARPEEMLLFQTMLFGAGRTEARRRAQQLIHEFDLEAICGKRASDLSGGNRRRLHCALALAHHPDVLFLDEPTTGMDPEARHRFWQVLRQTNQRHGVTLFLTTQYLEEADKHTDRLGLLVGGTLLFTGDVTEFKGRFGSDPRITLEESYLSWLGSPANSPEAPNV